MADIFDEIKEELKEEKWLALWKKYQNHVYSVVLGVVILSTAFVFWQKNERSKNLEASGKYIRALQNLSAKRSKTALGVLEEIPLNNNGAYKDFSQLLVAAILQDQGDEGGAKEIYRSIVNDSSLGDTYRHLALLRLAYLGFDSEDPKALLKSLESIIGSKSPWRFSGLELTALLHVKLGEKDKAKEALQRLLKDAKDNKEDVPPFVTFRAESLLRSLDK